MTEEIIIDGVNVAGCEYMLNNKIKGKQHCPAKAMPYAKETSCICRKSIDTPYNFCKHNSNCYYKQLKRLKQENNAYKQSEQEAVEIIAELKQENKELKEENIEYDEELAIEKLSHKSDLETLEQYRSALEEINILAKNFCNACDEFKAKTYKNKNDCLYCNYGFIKTKINEVLE